MPIQVDRLSLTLFETAALSPCSGKNLTTRRHGKTGEEIIEFFLEPTPPSSCFLPTSGDSQVGRSPSVGHFQDLRSNSRGSPTVASKRIAQSRIRSCSEAKGKPRGCIVLVVVQHTADITMAPRTRASHTNLGYYSAIPERGL